MILTALVQPVEPVDVILAHLGGLANLNIAVRDGHHCRAVVLGECIPGGNTCVFSELLHIKLLFFSLKEVRRWVDDWLVD